jgi:hypothetical protein
MRIRIGGFSGLHGGKKSESLTINVGRLKPGELYRIREPGKTTGIGRPPHEEPNFGKEDE